MGRRWDCRREVLVGRGCAMSGGQWSWRPGGTATENSRRELRCGNMVGIDVPTGALAGMLLEVLLLMSGPSHSCPWG